MDTTTVMETTPVDDRTAAVIEAAEMRAWSDMFDACPPAFAEEAGVGKREVDGALVINWAATGRRYFSRAIGLGVVAPVTEAGVDDILEGYRELGIGMFLLQSMPHCRPAAYEDWLRARGLEPFDRQDRIVRGGEAAAGLAAASAREIAAATGRAITVERVSADTAPEWAEFLPRVYRLDTGDWLPELVDRPGWHQYVAREGGEIVGARGMYIGPEGTAWLGMDGPVPGVMVDDHEPDTAICARIVEDGLALGAERFIADIEAPSPTQDDPAYERFARLGFTRPYVRTHWAFV